MRVTLKDLAANAFRLRGRKPSVALLLWGNWILIGVCWGMSLKAYFGLHGRMALWSSLWRDHVFVAKTPLFFFFPAVQLAVLLAALAAARRLLVKRSDPDETASLKLEFVYLELIFANILFIHFQTSLILVSYNLGRGVNRSYVTIIVAVMIMLVPYYGIRRRVLHR